MNKIVSLYLSRKDVPARMDVVQGATAPGITFILEDYTPDNGAQAQIFIKKKESEVYNTCTIDGNEVTFNPSTGSFDEVGKCEAQLEITSGGAIAVSYRIYVTVEPNIIDGEAIEASDDFSALQDAIRAVGDITEYKAQTDVNTDDIADIQSKTDLITIGNDMLWAVNASNEPYMRWKKNGTNYQLRLANNRIVFETQASGGSWVQLVQSYNYNYLAGESITISFPIICAGHVTNGGKDLQASVPLPRRTLGRTVAVALNKTNGLSVRTGVGGYVEASEYIDTTASGYTITATPNESGIFLTISKPEQAAWTNVQNNMAVSVAIRGTITFS